MKEVDVLGQNMRVPDYPDEIIREKKSVNRVPRKETDTVERPRRKRVAHGD